MFTFVAARTHFPRFAPHYVHMILTFAYDSYYFQNCGDSRARFLQHEATPHTIMFGLMEASKL